MAGVVAARHQEQSIASPKKASSGERLFELGVCATALARRLRLSEPAVSKSMRRGAKIAFEKGFQLLKE
jgi:hypothetical protein